MNVPLGASPFAAAAGLLAGHEPVELFAALDQELATSEVELECCGAGGALMRFTFRADTLTRRPDGVFADPSVAERAEQEVGRRLSLEPGWLGAAVRAFLGADPDGVFEGRRLRVLAAPPDYVLAMKCAASVLGNDPDADADIRYLLRFLGVPDADRAFELVDAYLGPRQRPDDLRGRFEAWLS